jgi:RNA polymerase sigma factor (sigma-70 family)
MQYLIGEWFRRSGLRVEEWEEVRQEAWLGFLRAVMAFADDRQGSRGPACFRTFMDHVVWKHLSDWDRQRRRTDLRYDRSADWTAVLDRSARNTPGDPAEFALRQEFRARLTAELKRLGTTQRWLVEQKADGRSLRDLAGERCLSYHKAKRLFRQGVGVLRQAVR